MGERTSGWEALRKDLIRDLGRILLKTNALQLGAFTLTSRKLSSYYIDMRTVPSFPDHFRRVISCYTEMARNLLTLEKIDVIGGIPTAGLTYATGVAYELRKPLIYVRKEDRIHGTGKMIEGVVTPGWRVLIIDDLITTGRSILRAAEKIRGEGARVEDALVLIDRKEGGRERLKEAGIELWALADVLELARMLYDMDLVSEEQKEAIERQVGGQ